MKKVKKDIFDVNDGIKFSLSSPSGIKYYTQGENYMGLHQSHRLTARGIEIPYGNGESWKTVLPFHRFDGDTYVVENYNNDYKIAYNEKSLGIFIKRTSELVELKRVVLTKITNFLWQL